MADSRPRIRGRFARNDEIVEIPTTEDEDTELWVNSYSKTSCLLLEYFLSKNQVKFGNTCRLSMIKAKYLDELSDVDKTCGFRI